jgi:hypothetical protein
MAACSCPSLPCLNSWRPVNHLRVAESFFTSSGNPLPLWKPKFHIRVHKNPNFGPHSEPFESNSRRHIFL